MEEHLKELYLECLDELERINIDLKDENQVGKIDINIAKRKTKRYGCCKQEEPDKNTAYRIKRKICYNKFNVHHIEISKWVMDLNDEIIKNTIIHELIHCLPYCNNHGRVFKSYASLINKKLGYKITRAGNKREDFKKSNIEFNEEDNYKYKISCSKCGYIYYRKRLVRNFLKKYQCGICRGRLQILEKY